MGYTITRIYIRIHTNVYTRIYIRIYIRIFILSLNRTSASVLASRVNRELELDELRSELDDDPNTGTSPPFLSFTT